jgi:outer membrane receptor protein involved in Fe transport
VAAVKTSRPLRAGCACRSALAGVTLVTWALDPTPARADEGALDAEARAEPEPEPIEVTVQAPPPRSSPGSTRLSATEARQTAGTRGDAVRAIQNVAGAARSAFGSGQLVIWGAAPGETLNLLDGMEMPSLFHTGGFRSIVPSPLIRSVELLPGGFGVEYGRALGGVALVETSTLPDEGLHGFVSSDLFDTSAGLTLSTPSLRLGLSARASYFDALARAVVDEDIGDLYPIPRYQDAQLKLTAPLGNGAELSAIVAHTSDQLERVRAAVDPSLEKRERIDAFSDRVGLRYRAADEDTATLVSAWFGVDLATRDLTTGAISASLGSRAVTYGLRAEHRRDLASARVGDLELRVRGVLGLDGVGRSTALSRTGSLTIPPREGDVFVFGQPPGGEVGRDDWRVGLVDAAPYAALPTSLGPILLTPGVRLNAMLVEVSRQLPAVGATPPTGLSRFRPTVDPRLALTVAPAEGTVVGASVGSYHQAPDPRDLSSVFGSPSLEAAEALHVTGSFSTSIASLFGAEAVGYFKSSSRLAVRTEASPPRLARALVSAGSGRAYGLNVTLRQRPLHGFRGALAYALSRSERSVAGGVRLFDFDQTHVLSLLLNQAIAGFDFGLRARVATGMPRTAIVGAFYNARDDRIEPVFGGQNQIRLPTFFQLDLRAEKELVVGPVTVRFFVDVENVTNQANVEELAYDFGFSEQLPIRGLPVLGVAGVAAEF